MAWLILCGSPVEAKDLGVYGSLYEIHEQDALEWITQKLHQLESSGELENQQNLMREKATSKILRPSAVKGLKKTTKPRTFMHDLTVELPNDIVDADGKPIFTKGTRINPLDFSVSSKALLFLDGDDVEQVKWALQEHSRRGDLVKLILINGPIIKLMEQTQIRFYFDQSGRLVSKFKIEQIPAVVEQKGNQLQISEVKVK